MTDDKELRLFASRLMDWYAHGGARQLPWRATRDPYAIWLSEVILQQTRVEQGRPYWERFMAEWPTVELLAAADEDSVLKAWQGLGYYSRARNLLAAARQVARAGTLPTTAAELRQLKGVGDYTAAAIASFAFEEPVAVVDGNVYRVLARYFAIDTPINTTGGKREFQTLADRLITTPPRPLPSAYNQAIMDFGATQCTPAQPACDVCPMAPSCRAAREGLTALLPVKLRKTAVKDLHLIYIYTSYNGLTALRRRPTSDIWAGLYEPLTATPSDPRLATSRLLARGVKHQLTHRRITADFYLYQPQEEPQLPEGYQWVSEERIDDFAVPRLVEKLFERVAEAREKSKKNKGIL